MRSVMTAQLAALFFLVLLLPAVMPVAGVDTAWSAPRPPTEIRILSNVLVKHKDVSLLEICDPKTLPADWKSIMDALNIGDAPPVGSEKFIDPGQLRAYLVTLLNSHGINPSKVKLDIPEKIVVMRESTQVSQEWIEKIFKKYIFENTPWKQKDITIQRVRFSGIPVIPTGKLTYVIKPFSTQDRFIGNVTVTVALYVDGEKVRTLDVLGDVEVFENVYFASRPLRRNEIISAADLEVHRMNITDAVDRYATRPDQVENRRVLYDIGMHQPLELNDLDKPLVVKRGDPVKIVYEEPGLSVTAKGRAKGDAGIGDTLAVTNISSRKTIYCKVVDSQTVRAVP